MKKTCFLSIDVESSQALLKQDFSSENAFECVEKLDRILDIFKKHNLKATLFVTGEVLESYRGLVKEWTQNHEIACHNYQHISIDELDSAEREKQVRNFSELYKNVLGKIPKGFRAPRNIIDNRQLTILEKYGFDYDSSVFPRYPWRLRSYAGYKGKAPVQPYFPSSDNYKKKGDMKLLEIPEAPALLNFPLVGTWLRKLGVSFFKLLFWLGKPKFISFSMHSWDGIEFGGKNGKNSGEKFLKQLDQMLGFLKKIGYEFKTGEEIFETYKNK